MHVYRSKLEPNRENPSREERWRQADQGLIMCWERGREIAKSRDPELSQLAARASAGELVPLPWKGGISPPSDKKQKEPAPDEKEKIKKKAKKGIGTLYYL